MPLPPPITNASVAVLQITTFDSPTAPAVASGDPHLSGTGESLDASDRDPSRRENSGKTDEDSAVVYRVYHPEW